MGHAIATSEAYAYIAAEDALRAFDVHEGDFDEFGTLDGHAGDMGYDNERDIIWIAGHDTVYGYHADDNRMPGVGPVATLLEFLGIVSLGLWRRV